MIFIDAPLAPFALDVFIFQGKMWWFFTKLILIWGVGIFPCVIGGLNKILNGNFNNLGFTLAFCLVPGITILVDYILFIFTCIPYNERKNIFVKSDANKADDEEDETEAEEGDSEESDLAFDIDNCDQYTEDDDYFGCLDLCSEVNGVACE